MSELRSELLPHERAEALIAKGKMPMGRADALLEANRCLFCHDAPCVRACPTSIEVPVFIKRIAEGNLNGSAHVILSANMLGSSCARVCPVEELCEGACVYHGLHAPPIAIGQLQRYACESALASDRSGGPRLFQPKPAVARKVALIGAGPASLACAAYLALAGVQAEIFEKSQLPGGLNTHGIAPYKLTSQDALEEVDWLLSHGAVLRCGQALGRDFDLDRLRATYDAVFIGIGLGADRMLDLPGMRGPGVFGATAWIDQIKTAPGLASVPKYSSIAVIGGGNTALDVARELRAFAVPEVVLFYRRSESEMSGYSHELAAARKQGARLVSEAVPHAVRRDQNGAVLGLEWRSRTGGEPHFHPCDALLLAVGQEPASALLPAELLDGQGLIRVDSARRTAIPAVFAGGDCVNGGKEVVNAAADGREAAFAMLHDWGLPRPV